MIYGLSRSDIGSDGTESIYGMLEEPKLDEKGVWNGCKAFNIANNHKNNSATVSTFVWLRGAPANWQVIKTYKCETFGIEEIEKVLKECGVYE